MPQHATVRGAHLVEPVARKSRICRNMRQTCGMRGLILGHGAPLLAVFQLALQGLNGDFSRVQRLVQRGQQQFAALTPRRRFPRRNARLVAAASPVDPRIKRAQLGDQGAAPSLAAASFRSQFASASAVRSMGGSAESTAT